MCWLVGLRTAQRTTRRCQRVVPESTRTSQHHSIKRPARPRRARKPQMTELDSTPHEVRSVVKMQSMIRKHMARREFSYLLRRERLLLVMMAIEDEKATCLQTQWRQRKASRRGTLEVRSATKLQAAVRGKAARTALLPKQKAHSTDTVWERAEFQPCVKLVEQCAITGHKEKWLNGNWTAWRLGWNLCCHMLHGESHVMKAQRESSNLWMMKCI